MIEAISDAFKFLISCIGQLLKAFPQWFGIDEWYLFYTIAGIVAGLFFIIFKKKKAGIIIEILTTIIIIVGVILGWFK